MAIVTGAGRGIGRAYARLLAARGASVLVNDLGGAMDGSGSDAGPAAAVVAEIVAAGGAAIADGSDVSTVEGAEALIAAAIAAYGRLDVLINNAGIMRWAGMPEVDVENLDAHLAVHLHGSFNTARAAWPHFTAQGYGRIVMTTSSGVFGLPQNLSYAAAKGGTIGLVRSMATVGRGCGIAINAIAPAAMTRMAGRASGDLATTMAPELAAPMAAFLAHETCPVNGEIYTAGAGRFARLFIGSTPGYVVPGGSPSIEDVAGAWEAINSETGYTVPTDLMAWSDGFTSHLDEN